jgi:hypothetical protein
MGIETSLNEKEYDLTNSKYSINEDNALTMHSDEFLDTSLYAKTKALKIKHDHILIKRQNLKQLKTLYPNKVFAANHMDSIGGALDSVGVGHAPQHVYDMTLDEYLSLIPLDRINFIWLDMKNLEEKDISSVIEKLNKLDEKYKLKNRMLIENTLVSPKMKEFSENGWRNCFYLYVQFDSHDINGGFPYELLPLMLNLDKLSHEGDIKLRKFAYEIAKYTQKQKSTDLSFFANLYPFVKKIFRTSNFSSNKIQYFLC